MGWVGSGCFVGACGEDAFGSGLARPDRSSPARRASPWTVRPTASGRRWRGSAGEQTSRNAVERRRRVKEPAGQLPGWSPDPPCGPPDLHPPQLTGGCRLSSAETQPLAQRGGLVFAADQLHQRRGIQIDHSRSSRSAARSSSLVGSPAPTGTGRGARSRPLGLPAGMSLPRRLAGPLRFGALPAGSVGQPVFPARSPPRSRLLSLSARHREAF